MNEKKTGNCVHIFQISSNNKENDSRSYTHSQLISNSLLEKNK